MLGSKTGRTVFWKSWLFAPPLRGASSAAVTVGLIVVPTVIRLTIASGSERFECSTFCPFILAAAILVGWRYAAAVALASAAICNVLPAVPYRFHGGEMEMTILTSFLLYSFIVIGLVHLARRLARQSLRHAGAEERSGGIVFSSEDGDAWASWYGTDPPIRLGPEEEVARMMKDFLAQLELGKRLLNRRRG